MWRTLTLLIVMSLVRLGASQGNESSPDPGPPAAGNASMPDATTVTTDAPGGNGTSDMRCMNPTEMVTGARMKEVVLNALNKLRENMPTLKPQNHGACRLEKLKWDDKLMESAMDVAMKCPMPSVGPTKISFMSHHEGNFGETVMFTASNSSMRSETDDVWERPIKDMSDDEWRSVVDSYKTGPWDPIFQAMWSGTQMAGCSWVAYNNSDLAELSNVFNMTVTMPMELQSIVCHFSPPGCVVGEKPWRFCGFKPDRTDGPGPHPEPDDFTTPHGDEHNDPTDDSTDKPFGADATRVCAEIGFNFETLSIASILIANLVPC